MRHGRLAPPLAPVLAAAALLPPIAYVGGPGALAAAAVTAALAVLCWRAVRGARAVFADAAAGIFAVLYVPTLVGFAMLLLHADDGVARIVTFMLVTICSDVGGYAVGVVAGKHPIAPSVSPKKSWEGFAGSAVACVVCASVCVRFLLDGPVWAGVLLGLLAVCSATIGDLCESLIKRDLSIKDMSDLIPGHGGLMDRLDSLLMTVPVVWAVLTAFVP